MRHMRIEQMPQQGGRITQMWRVVTNDGIGNLLGVIRWHAPWRKYAFFPEDGTLFEQDCLQDLSQTLIDKTAEHRSRLKRPPQASGEE